MIGEIIPEGGFLLSLPFPFVLPVQCVASFVKLIWHISKSELAHVSIIHLLKHPRGEANTKKLLILPLCLHFLA